MKASFLKAKLIEWPFNHALGICLIYEEIEDHKFEDTK